jgi:hypothetical protein
MNIKKSLEKSLTENFYLEVGMNTGAVGIIDISSLLGNHGK